MFADESEALTHPYLAHMWAKRGADLRIEAPGQAKRRAMLGALDHAAGQLLLETSITKRSSDFIDLLARLDRDYAPQPGRDSRPVVLVLDNGPIHTSKATTKALAARAAWLTVEWLPKYAPELNDIERTWRDLKRHHLAHRTFTDADALDQANKGSPPQGAGYYPSEELKRRKRRGMYPKGFIGKREAEVALKPAAKALCLCLAGIKQSEPVDKDAADSG